MKSKSTAYILWFFFGLFGFHKFYLGRVGTGILYLFTFGIFGIGWFIDLFTLGSQVDMYNLMYMNMFGKNGNSSNSNVNNVVVNVPHYSNSNLSDQLHKLSELKEKGLLTEEEFNNQKVKLLA